MKFLLALAIPLLGILADPVARADAPKGPSPEVPELQPLNEWVGMWDTQMKVMPNADLPNGGSAKGVASAEWIHDGRFLRQTWSMKSAQGVPLMTGSTVMTYDPRKKVYRSWSFYSSGFVGDGQGVWDSTTRTMTWTSHDAEDGRTMITKASFATPGTENWSIVEQDRGGRVIAETTGKNIRRKE
jgi:hypothetical protein